MPAALLSTIGVVVSALRDGCAAYVLFDLSWLESVLLGAVVSSTDAAAVFATLRFTHIRRRLARTLEAESGGNDPMAIALTLGLIAWIERPDAYGIDDLLLLVVQQLGLGLVVGVALGRPRGLGVRPPPPLDRRLRAGRVARGGRARVRCRRRDRRQRLPLRLSRRARGRQHAVALSPPPRLVPRGAGVRGPGRALHRSRPARLPVRSPGRGRAGARTGTVPDARRAAGVGLGFDCVERLHEPRAAPARLGRPPRRGADRARHLRPLLGRAGQGHDLQRRLLRRRRLGDRAGDDARAGSRPAGAARARPHPCTRRRSRWGR